jgi:4-oxalocrotonate tautomerase
LIPLSTFSKEEDMPVIIFEGSRLDLDKKRELIRELTDTAVRVTGIGAPAFTTDTAVRVTGIGAPAFTIYIHENEHDNIGVGGELLTEILRKG